MIAFFFAYKITERNLDNTPSLLAESADQGATERSNTYARADMQIADNAIDLAASRHVLSRRRR
jgi:hypothetical protein